MDRHPPYSEEAEQSVLGAILRNPEAIVRVQDILVPDDFYLDKHKKIYQAMLDLFNDSIPTDLVMVTESLRKNGLLDRIGAAFVASLTEVTPTAANIEHYARIVKEKSIVRQVISRATKIVNLAYEGEYESAEELVNKAEAAIFQIGMKSAKSTLTKAKDLVIKQMEAIYSRDAHKGITGISTTFKILDIWTAGWQRGELIVIAARPSMGKTSWAFQMAKDAAIKNGHRVAIFSLEINKEAAVEKLLINESMIDGQRARIGKLLDGDDQKLARAANRIAQAGIYIDDTPAITVPEIRTKCRKMKAEVGLDMIVIDYLQLMSSHKKTENRQREMSEITRSLKLLARELDVPVLVLSQLSRAVEYTADKKPNLSHLKDSGAIEADADVVVFLYRPEYYFPDTDKKGITEIIFAKQRNGPVGTVELAFLKNCTKFVSITTRPEDMGTEVKGEWPGEKSD